MKKTFVGLLAALSVLVSCSSNEPTNVVTPNARQLAWADAEVGVLIHFDMPVYQPDYNFRKWGTHPDASIFNPTELNTDQWLETAHKLGAQYAVLVAKHCSGFSFSNIIFRLKRVIFVSGYNSHCNTLCNILFSILGYLIAVRKSTVYTAFKILISAYYSCRIFTSDIRFR